MIVEISLLLIMVQQAIIQGEQINFVNQGKIVTSTIGNQMDNNQTLYEWAIAYDGADVSDIEFDEVDPISSQNRFLELD
ncbi:hypothetical protein LP123_11360 [Moraxella bovis]|uniref:Uncharacterized protein n=1 Tax=Moraxella bovis TaxID=476 RepID=A0AAQ2Q1J5_MORBO|nr:hypothetical protein [Moraxella bovis]AWY21031.1 hypothetical protein DQF64_11410 [Moraxella bovis]UYZ76303.1 hypothetical protein LP093_02990 [Moraxella bovis]UYZ77745.1 hypothetical protein LP115_10815 [Moraxella bovis]UYZ81747.1 hypothetical protein LP113_03150 [Moraxella bovis]UYZ86231.1 hypothetical protein LP094_10865 [Moraxella bovis]